MYRAGRSPAIGTRTLRLGLTVVVAALAIALAPGAGAATAANLSLNVSFSVDGTISVTLPDGTPLGSTSGQPTVIPAGFYTVQMSGPGGCNELPYFLLNGPGVNLQDNMELGELKATDTAVLQPSSTYTWRDDALPDVVHTFTTSSTVLGTPPPTAASPVPTRPHSTVSSKDVVGSAVSPAAALVGHVGRGGRVTLTRDGKKVTRLPAGRYTIVVVDTSRVAGFSLTRAGRPAMSVTSTGFVGRHSRSVDLTAGAWRALGVPGARAMGFTVIAGHASANGRR